MANPLHVRMLLDPGRAGRAIRAWPARRTTVTSREMISEPRDQGGRETGRQVSRRDLPVRFGGLTGGMYGWTQICRVGR